MRKKTEIAKTEQRTLTILDAVLKDQDKLKELPIETVERLVALHERLAATAAKEEFYKAFFEVQKNLKPVAKEGKITRKDGSVTLYAELEHIIDMLDPIIHEHGFSRSFAQAGAPSPLPGHSRFVLTLRHIGGHSELHYLDAPIDAVTGPKGGSVMNKIQGQAAVFTYCERHTICKVFGLQLVEDTDGNLAESAGPTITEEELMDLKALITEVKYPMEKFFKFFKIEKLEDLPQNRLAQAIAGLEKRR